MGSDYQIVSFFGAWQLCVCLFAFLGLMSIWYHIGRKQGDFGQVWLALSILCWSILGYIEVNYSFALLGDQWNCQPGLSDFEEIQQEEMRLLTNLNGWRSILSLMNSLFILLALPWFRHLPKFLEPIIKSKNWYLIVGLPFLFSLLPTISKLFTGANSHYISELDVYYSILTLMILGFVLWESFTKRRLRMLAYLTVVCILITFVAQVFKLSPSANGQILLSAIFKTSLIMIFFALALSWVKDLVEKVKIEAEDIYVQLRKEKVGRSFSNIIQISGLASEEKEFNLTNKNFELLTNFIKRKQETEKGWMEIKPKAESRSGKQYDIQDHNEIKRLLHAILDGVYGKGLWSKTEHELPLKEVFFELSAERERKIRLSLPIENLKL